MFQRASNAAWYDGRTAAGMLEAETRFRKVEGYRGLATLAVKIEQDLIRKRQLDSHTSAEEELATLTM